MKKILGILSLVLILSGAKANAMGLFYTNTTYPITATGSEVQDLSTLKKGSASANNILYLVEIGDVSIDTAAKNGNIKKISHIDIQEKSIFVFWRRVRVNVYGE